VGDLTNRASVLRGLGRSEEAVESIEEALRFSEEPGASTHRHVEALYVCYTLYRDTGRTEEGRKYLEQAIQVQSADRFTVHQPWQASALAGILLEHGDIDEAVELLTGAVERSRKSRYAFGLSQCQQHLAQMLVGLGRKDEALPHLREAAETFGRLRDSESQVRMLAAAAPILEERGEREEARRCWATVGVAAGGGRERVEALRGLARLNEAEGNASAALEHLEQALEIGAADDEQRADLLNSLGILEWKGGRYEQALERYREALEIFERLDDPAHAGLLLNSIGATLRPLGRLDEAAETLTRALELHERSGEETLRGHALALLGDTAIEQGDTETALARYRESLELRRRIGDRRGEGWMRYGLARALLANGERERAEENAALAASIADEQADGELRDACARLDLG
jgi:tetratricopeptide (TPR) repeat protein